MFSRFMPRESASESLPTTGSPSKDPPASATATRETGWFANFVKGASGFSEEDFTQSLFQVLEEADRTLFKKVDDYNRLTPFGSYLLYGDLSAFQFVWMKVLRILNLIDTDGEAQNESLDDSIRDLGNYCRLWEAWRLSQRESDVRG